MREEGLGRLCVWELTLIFHFCRASWDLGSSRANDSKGRSVQKDCAGHTCLHLL